MTPAEELRTAATRLRETAAEATGGPWENGEDDHLWIGGSVWGYSVRKKGEFLNGDPAWIALANPALAEPLAQLLEDQAAMYEDFLPRGTDIAERIVWRGLGVARVVNGGAL